jgi:hypothetical protein
MNIHPENYCAQRQSSVIPVTNFVFNAAWQKLRLSDGTPWTARAAGCPTQNWLCHSVALHCYGANQR